MPRPGDPRGAKASAFRAGDPPALGGGRGDPRGARAAALTEADGGRFEMTRASVERLVGIDVRNAEAARPAPAQ